MRSISSGLPDFKAKYLGHAEGQAGVEAGNKGTAGAIGLDASDSPRSGTRGLSVISGLVDELEKLVKRWRPVMSD